MKLCFPVKTPDAIESEVYGHFGSAPAFLVVDPESREVTTVHNVDQDHVHGMCQPLRALDGHRVDGIVVAGIGQGALMKLAQAGIAVYQAVDRTVKENLELFNAGKLPRFLPSQVCAGRNHGGGCSH
jgi:predicted Fe-Mo cluster-binding NifX family protein